MTTAYRCDHLHLRSPDPAAAAAFYVEALGAKETARMPVRDRLRVILDLGGLTVFIEEVPADTARAPATTPFVGIEHIGLAVDDLDAALDAHRARGTRITAEAQQVRPGVRIAFLEGPDGVVLELLERRAV
jgi:catechol 2,3-dioxygenase-like lactoylglutathione lyase family enzyme